MKTRGKAGFRGKARFSARRYPLGWSCAVRECVTVPRLSSQTLLAEPFDFAQRRLGATGPCCCGASLRRTAEGGCPHVSRGERDPRTAARARRSRLHRRSRARNPRLRSAQFGATGPCCCGASLCRTAEGGCPHVSVMSRDNYRPSVYSTFVLPA
jgi:hypothetical protein